MKNSFKILVIAVVVFGCIYAIVSMTQNYGKPAHVGTTEMAPIDNKIIKPTEEEILSMYEKAQEIYLWFAETVPTEKLDYKNSIEDGVYLIKDERFSTLKELKEYMSEIFAEEIIEKIEEKRFDTNLIFEMDGNLYMSEYVTPKDIYCGKERIENIEYTNDNTIVITVLAEVLSEDMETVEKEEEHKFILNYDNGKWKFSEFYCIGFYL